MRRVRDDDSSSRRERPTARHHRAPTGPLWYKDAVIYELHVRAFHDGNGDGIGDFRGLIDKLDYLQDLGVTALWLLPFYPSPLRDDGYDISDYRQRPPVLRHACGTSGTFLREAHRRGMRVITELVLAHTSDEHPWFQRARAGRPGQRDRDFYVWSDTPDRFADARVIFKDFETSNWTCDPVAGAYFWHRFYSHQPEPQLRQPGGPAGDARRRRLLALDGRRRAPSRRRPVPLRPRGHHVREPARDLRVPARRCAPTSTSASRDGCCWPRPTSGPRTRWPTWARATRATWRSTSPSCRGCSWRPARRTGSRWSTSCRRRPTTARTASGRCSCATTTS